MAAIGVNVNSTKYDYIFGKDDTTYYALNGKTRKIDYSGTVAHTVIRNALEALWNGGATVPMGSVFFEKGEYLLDGMVKFYHDYLPSGIYDGLTVESNGAIFKANWTPGTPQYYRILNYGPFYENAVVAAYGRNIRIQGIIVDGNNKEGLAGLVVYGNGAANEYFNVVQDCEAKNVTTHDAGGGSYINGQGIMGDGIFRSTIKRCSSHDNFIGIAWHGYSPITSIDEGNLIEGNNAYHNSSIGIYTSHVNGAKIIGNDAQDNGAGAYADFGCGGMWIGEGATLENCWTIMGNTIANNRGFGLYTAGGAGDRYNIIGNAIYNNDTAGFIPGSNCVFKQNFVMNNGQVPGGIDMESSGVRLYVSNTIYDAVIEDNYFQDDQAVITQKYHVWCSRVAGARISLKNNTFKCKTGIEAVKLFGSGAFDIFEGNKGLIASGSDRSWCDENSGTSTGTGAQQTIAHGLRTTPTRVILSESTTGAALAYQSAAADATNIYVTAVLNKTWQWEAKVR